MTDADIERVARKLCGNAGVDPDGVLHGMWPLESPQNIETPIGTLYAYNIHPGIPAWYAWRDMAHIALTEAEALRRAAYRHDRCCPPGRCAYIQAHSGSDDICPRDQS